MDTHSLTMTTTISSNRLSAYSPSNS